MAADLTTCGSEAVPQQERIAKMGSSRNPDGAEVIWLPCLARRTVSFAEFWKDDTWVIKVYAIATSANSIADSTVQLARRGFVHALKWTIQPEPGDPHPLLGFAILHVEPAGMLERMSFFWWRSGGMALSAEYLSVIRSEKPVRFVESRRQEFFGDIDELRLISFESAAWESLILHRSRKLGMRPDIAGYLNARLYDVDTIDCHPA